MIFPTPVLHIKKEVDLELGIYVHLARLMEKVVKEGQKSIFSDNICPTVWLLQFHQ